MSLVSCSTSPYCNHFPTVPNPPTTVSAIHETPTSIHVHWTPPALRVSRYEIFYQGEGDAMSMMEDVNSVTAEDWNITSGVRANIIYNITIVAIRRNGHKASTGPVIAARGRTESQLLTNSNNQFSALLVQVLAWLTWERYL